MFPHQISKSTNVSCVFKAHLAADITSLCHQYSASPVRVFPPAALPAAMLCPALLCAALLLLTPVEITDARALQQPSDAAQVWGGGADDRKGEIARRENRKESESNEMSP